MSDLTITSVLPSFGRSLKAARRSTRTIENYVSTARAFNSWLTSEGRPTEIQLMKRELVQAWLVSLSDKGNTPATLASRFRCLQQFFRWLVEEEEISESPMAKMRPPTIPEATTPILSHDEQNRLLGACGGRRFEDRRDLAIISFFIDSGLRLAELANLKLDEVDVDNHAAFVIGKGGRLRVARFGVLTARNLDRYLRARSAHPFARSEWLWLGTVGHGGRSDGARFKSAGIARMIDRRAARAGIDGIHPHVFRHTFAHEFSGVATSPESTPTSTYSAQTTYPPSSAPLATIPLAGPAHGGGYAADFQSPSGNIGCEIDYQRPGTTDQVYCQTISPPQSITMTSDGSFPERCSAENCLGNGPPGAPTLGYGESTTLGPFTCTSAETGMSCTTSGGPSSQKRGFDIFRSGIQPII